VLSLFSIAWTTCATVGLVSDLQEPGDARKEYGQGEGRGPGWRILVTARILSPIRTHGAPMRSHETRANRELRIPLDRFGTTWGAMAVVLDRICIPTWE